MSEVQALWATPLLRRRLPDAEALNRALLELCARERPAVRAPTWASADDLLQRHPGDEALQALFAWLSDGVFAAASSANEQAWAEVGASGLRIVVVGAWFQASNGGGRHGVHNHGNCSWSGVYYVDVDPPEVREAHPTLGALNGVTRFHGPHLARLGGAHMDLGSLYLQRSHHDEPPEPGVAVWFPSWLLHEVLPYEGRRDRVVISFNAQLRSRGAPSGPPFGF